MINLMEIVRFLLYDGSYICQNFNKTKTFYDHKKLLLTWE